MGTSNLMNRSYRIGRDGRTVVCDATAVRGEIDVLREALAWKRESLARVDYDDEAPLTIVREQALMLCELAVSYVAERDVESYQPPEERDRIAALRLLTGPLMDCCCEFAAAQDEVALREPPLPV
jgi:hypothetical protein